MKNQNKIRFLSLLLALLLLTGCSTPSEPAAEPEATENSFTATEPSQEDPNTEGSESIPDADEVSPIELTKDALAENDWMNLDTPEGYIGMPVNEAFSEALQFDAWESVDVQNDAVEVFRFALGNGEIVINEGSAYLLTDRGMDWYLIPDSVIGNLMMYIEENFTMSARSMLDNDERLFAAYYYDTIASLGNMDEFDGRGPLQYEMIEYAWYRYTYEQPQEVVNDLRNADGQVIFNRELAIQEAKRYFDFDEAATDFTKIDFYDAKADGFSYWYDGPDMDDRSEFNNPWGIEYDGTEELGDNRYEVRLISYADSAHTRVDRVNVYEIYFDGEGNLKFERGYQEKPSYNLADTLPGFEEIMALDDFMHMGGTFIGETDAAYFFISDDGEWVSYYRLDKATKKMEPAFAPFVEDDEYPYNVEQHGSQFYFYTTKRVLVTDSEWSQVKAVEYPEAILKARQDPWTYQATYFGEALSEDGSMFAYVDEDGLKLYTIATGQTELIKAKEGEEGDAIWCMNPRFVNGDSMILTARTRDYNSGFYLYNLKTKEEKTVDGYIVPMSWKISDGRGFFVTDKVHTYFYEFAAGKLKDLPAENRGPAVSTQDFLLCNDQYAAYFDEREDGKDLVSLNLATWKVEKRVPIQGVEAGLAFLSRNGDLGIRYFFTYDNLGVAVLENK